MHQGLSPVREVLELARRVDRLEREPLRLWIADCAWRVLVVDERDPPPPPLLPDFVALARRPRDTESARVLALARRVVFEDLEPTLEELLSLTARARAIAAAAAMRTADMRAPGQRPSPLDRRLAVGSAHVSRSTWAYLADEERWQAERLLLRLDLLPSPEDVLVQLDLAEAEGTLPSVPYSRSRLEQLRACVLEQRPVPVELLLEFLEMMFRTELRAGKPTQ